MAKINRGAVEGLKSRPGGRNTLLFKSKNNKCDTKRKPRTQGLREVTNSHQVFTALARSGPNSRKTKSRA